VQFHSALRHLQGSSISDRHGYGVASRCRLRTALATNLQLPHNLRKALQRRLQVFCDFRGQDVRFGQAVDVFEAVVFQPEQVEVEFVAFEQVLDGDALYQAMRNSERAR